ncbi:hypothetical protein [Chitinimonas taiwanensis]|uniref:Uncharacterized protein n=1 Tax=Chitinimonas taiwanensis DSM 18899 TaxID=1121279 RepID=A0A1K2HIL9_9NEIS|nr:hypothetical protein [Chitinimonas taiwanensis]SFZ76563.1 hypothetical protein SAMN02745887_02007 [Chitinimonas taiwanensis DSM 18899]
MTDTALPTLNLNDSVTLCLTGHTLPGHAPEAVAAGLAKLLKLDEARALALLAGQETVIKRALPREQLARYQQLLADAGAETRVREEAAVAEVSAPAAKPATPAVAATQPSTASQPDPSVAPVETVTCPACQCVQPRRTLCRDCGVDMPRMRAAQAAPREAERGPATQGARSSAGARQAVPREAGERGGLPWKPIAVGVVLCVAAALFWVQRSKLTEERVYDFYNEGMRATLKRDPDALCAQMADDFRGSGSASAAGVDLGAQEEVNKTQACHAMRELYASIEKIGEAMGGEMHIQYNRDIERIDIAADGQSAQVQYSYFLGVGGSVMQFRGEATETVVRSGTKILLQRAESTVNISGG